MIERYVRFSRAATNKNIESLLKLGIAYLYNEGRELDIHVVILMTRSDSWTFML